MRLSCDLLSAGYLSVFVVFLFPCFLFVFAVDFVVLVLLCFFFVSVFFFPEAISRSVLISLLSL